MSYFDNYKARFKHTGTGDSLKGSTIQLANEIFADAPTYTTVLIDGVSTGVRLIMDRDSSVKTMLFKPQTISYKGALVEIGSQNWLIANFDTDDVFPKSKIKLCNEHLRWKKNDVTINRLPCIATNSALFSDFRVEPDRLVSIVTAHPTGRINVFVQYNNETTAIRTGLRFILGNQVYKVVGVDDVSDVYMDKGVIRLSFELTEKVNGDDFINKLAMNPTTSIPTTPPSNGGDKLW